MSKKPTGGRTAGVSVASDFRRQIEALCAEGAAAEDLTLRLTHGDASRLRRDPAVAVADIAFGGGVMRYLGVKIVEGGVPASTLELTQA